MNLTRLATISGVLTLVIASLSDTCHAQLNILTSTHPVGYQDVKITDNFWAPRMTAVAMKAIPVCVVQTEEKTPRIRNFEKVARKKGEKHEGIYFDDSDVYKALEAIAYSLKNNPNSDLEKTADAWIDKIAAAQEPDGYLNTYYSLNGLDKRWSDMEKHEDYCAGHLMEAGVAYYNTTGKRKLLDVAARFADHIDATFRQQDRHWVSGHQEIELALVKLYYATQNRKYLELSDWFLQQRGKGYGKGVIWDDWKSPEYAQDKVPVIDQREITGHAVRAMYLYTGAADVAAATNNPQYMAAMKRVWEDVVYRNMYITGGIGSSGSNEGFSVDYDLPNEDAYCETCASVGMVFWNQRMNLLTGDSKYIDILERSLYNGALDGLSLSGERFFYGNPLASTGDDGRSEWFGTACCPSNISRLISSVGNYIYATSPTSTWINLYIGSNTHVVAGKTAINLSQTTNYPWEGKVLIKVDPEKKVKHELRLRIPGWATGKPVPGDTYQYTEATSAAFRLTMAGKAVSYRVENGYAVIAREWKKGDELQLDLPMEIKCVVANEKITEDQNKVAIERGPIVYCFEHVDNGGHAFNILLNDQAKMSLGDQSAALGGVPTIRVDATTFGVGADGKSIVPQPKTFVAIPYYTWANRGKGEMQVWVPRKVREVMIK